MYEVSIINDTSELTIHSAHDPPGGEKLPSGLIRREKNKIPSFTFQIYMNNPGYDLLIQDTTYVIARKLNGDIAFEGRVLLATPQMDEDGLAYKSVVCEGLKSFLRDSVQGYLEERFWEGDSTRTGLEEFIDYILDEHNSQVEDDKKIYRGKVTVDPFKTTDNVSKGLNYEDTYDCIEQKLINSFGGEMDVRRGSDGVLYLDYVQEFGVAKEVPIELGVNILSMSQKRDDSTKYTRLFPLGAKLIKTIVEDGVSMEVETEERLTIASVNNGIRYIDDEDEIKTRGVKPGVIIFDGITEAANLLERAEEYMESQNQGILSTTAQILNLSLIDGSYEEYELYNSYPLKNELLGIDTYVRIIGHTINIVEPEKSEFMFGDKNMTQSDYQQNTDKQAAQINALLSKAENDIKKNQIVAATLHKKVSGDLATFIAGDFETLRSRQATFEDVTANNLNAVNGEIATLKSTSITTTILEAEIAEVEKAIIEKADIKYATVDALNAVSGKVNTLDSEVADINTLIFGSASGVTIHTSFANAIVAQIGDAQIKSAMIDSVAASKITAGDIITNNVRVLSEDGRLIISDETIQISDGARVRVQIGKDAVNDYSINIWDAEGNLMFSKGGITDSAIKDAIIRNDMVSETANISASKLDINSLFEEINGSDKTINSTKVYLDEKNQTLDVAFTSMTSDVSGLSGKVTSQGTDISVIQGQISNKIWQQDINTVADSLGGSISTLNDQYSTLNQTVSGLSTTVANHTTAIANKADGSTVTEVSNKVSTLEQDFGQFKTTVSETYATSEGMASAISTAVTQTAKDLRVEISDAAKTATSFLSYDNTNGLLVGNKTNGSWSGSRAQILPSAFNVLDASGVILASFGATATVGLESDKNVYVNSESVDIRNGSTVLASFGANNIELGKNNSESIISLCGGNGHISYTDTGEDLDKKGLVIESQTNFELRGKGDLNFKAGDDTLTSTVSGRRSTLYIKDTGVIQLHAHAWGNDEDGAYYSDSSLVWVDWEYIHCFTDGEFRVEAGAISLYGDTTRPKYNNSELALYSDITAAVGGAYLPLSGGKMTGPISFKDNSALPSATEMKYVCGISAFADGGTLQWQNKETFLADYAKTSDLDNYALKADIATTKYAAASNSAAIYFKISDFGAWGSGAWYQKGFSMLINSRAGEMVWVAVSSDDSNTNAKAIRLLNTYTKILNIYYSVSESAIYVRAQAWCNNVSAHIISNLNGDYVPTVAQASALASDAVEIKITEFGAGSSTTNIGDSTRALTMTGSATRPTYNGGDLALYSDLSGYALSGHTHGNYVDLASAQTITGVKTFNAPANVASTEQTTVKFKTSNGGAIIIGKEGPNSGTMLRFDQVDGTCRLRFRGSATAGAIVWEQPEQGAQLYIDLGKSGSDYRRITFPASAGTLALTSQLSNYALASHTHSYLPLSGGTLTGKLIASGGVDIRGTAASMPLKVRGIVGSDGNGTVEDLYLQYGANKLVHFGNDGAYTISADGGTYSGTANKATHDGNGNNIVNTYATQSWVTTQISNASISGGSVDLSDYARLSVANTYNGEQKFQNSSYCPTVTDTASGVGCAFKASRGMANELLVDKLIMTASTGKIPFYTYTGTSGGSMTGLTEVASISSAGVFSGTATKATQDGNGNNIASTYLPLSGGTMTGPLVLTGGDAASGVGNMQLDTNGQITAKGTTSTLFGRTSATSLYLGHSSHSLTIRGSGSAPTYNGQSMDVRKVLYDNSTGTYGTVTLSETAANFSMLEIIVGYSDIYGCQSIKVYSPNSKVVDISSVLPTTGANINAHRTRCTISGTSITQSYNGRAIHYANMTTAGVYAENVLYIKTVIGYR